MLSTCSIALVETSIPIEARNCSSLISLSFDSGLTLGVTHRRKTMVRNRYALTFPWSHATKISRSSWIFITSRLLNLSNHSCRNTLKVLKRLYQLWRWIVPHFFNDNVLWTRCGVTGQQGMLNPPWHPIPPLDFRGPCCPLLILFWTFLTIFFLVSLILVYK